jgi:hypothetical protein
MYWVLDDGGRKAAGFKGETGDCVVRAITIATQLPYKHVYDTINELAKLERPRKKKRSNARTGVQKPTIKRFMESVGWIWTPTMFIGQGCRVHLRKDELPAGRLVVNVSKHMVAVIDGIVHDTHDPCREGTRCVYGYWKEPDA